MMEWLVQYFADNIKPLYTSFDQDGCYRDFAPGHIIEALTGMFLCLETLQGSTCHQLDIECASTHKGLGFQSGYMEK
jgi:hypothetical protein